MQCCDRGSEIEKFLRQVAHENGIRINFDPPEHPYAGVAGRPQAVALKRINETKPAPKKPAPKLPAPKGDDDVYSDDSDLESCDDED